MQGESQLAEFQEESQEEYSNKMGIWHMAGISYGGRFLPNI